MTETTATQSGWNWKEAFNSWAEKYGDKASSPAPEAKQTDITQTATLTREAFINLEKENPKAAMDFCLRGGKIADSENKKKAAISFPDLTKNTITREQFELLEKENPKMAMDFCLNGGRLS